MYAVKHLFPLIPLLILAICWKFPATVCNSTNSNSVQRKENVVTITGNENLIFPKGNAKNRISKINVTQTSVDDGKISKEKNTPAAKKIKSGEMKLKIAKLFAKNTTMIASEIDTTKATEILEIPTANLAITSNQSLAREIRSDTIQTAEGDREENKIQKKIRTPVKLNMKQGLVMNQILSTYGLNDVNRSLCKDHINEFKQGLRALEPWALKMFDASSKLMSGILSGNLAELGTFKQCLNIYEETEYGSIRGQHCTLNIHPTDELLKIVLNYRKVISEKHFQNLKNNILDGVKLSWSVCVPDSCTYEDVLRHFNKSIVDLTEGLNLTLSLTEEHCVSINDLPKFTKGDYVYIFCVGLVMIAVIISTVVDAMSEDSPPEIISLFSIKRNANILFSTRENRNDISCLHGLRFLSMYLVVYGHRFIHNMATPVVNYMDLVDWLESYLSTTVHGGTTTVDTFFLVSSTLTSYTFFNIVSNGTKVNLILYYFNRHLRLLVPLALAVSTYATVVKHFGTGPLYQDMSAYFVGTCSYFWWSILLNIQPFVNPRQMCVVQTWYLSVDMFCYYVSPLVLFPLARNRITSGYTILIVMYVGCTVINFYVAWIYEFNGQMPVTPGLLSADYFAFHYTQPLVRGGPYILGLAFGHALYKTKDQKVTISAFTKTAGWILVSVCLPSVVLITRLFRLEDFEYNRVFASLFLACHRSVWTFGIMWIIWCCQNGQGGLVNSFLSCDLFKILGRLCYNIFLFHYLFQAVMQNSKKTPSYFSHFLTTFESLADIVTMTLLSIPLTLCFEYPFSRMCGVFFRAKSSKSLVSSFLSCNLFKILRRICYNIFLFHYLFQAVMQNSKRMPSNFSHFLTTFDSISDIATLTLLSIPLTLCFAYPFSRMFGVFFKAKSRKSNIVNVKPQDKKKA